MKLDEILDIDYVFWKGEFLDWCFGILSNRWYF